MLEQANHFSFSRLNTLSQCRMKYYHQYIAKSERLEPVKDYFRVGIIVDEALRAVATNLLQGFSDFCNEHNITFLESKWEAYAQGVWEGRRQLYQSVFGEKQSLELQKLIRILIVNKQTGEVIANEAGEPIEMVGYLDAYDSESNTIFEVRTVSGGIDQTFTEHKFGGQTQIYAHSLMETEGVKEIPKVIYAYIKKPSIRQKKDETEEQFNLRMYEAGFNATVEFREVQYTAEEINETMQFYYERISSDLHAEPVRDRTACFKFGHRCEFYGHCWKNQVSSELIELGETA